MGALCAGFNSEDGRDYLLLCSGCLKTPSVQFKSLGKDFCVALHLVLPHTWEVCFAPLAGTLAKHNERQVIICVWFVALQGMKSAGEVAEKALLSTKAQGGGMTASRRSQRSWGRIWFPVSLAGLTTGT